jgi:transcriptional regulator GlxA family with amidase domain
MARLLLRDGQLAMAEVAFLLGYQAPTAFQASVPEVAGHSPRAYRRAAG